MSSDPFEQFTEAEKQKMLSLFFQDRQTTDARKAEALKLFENNSYESAFIGAKQEVKDMGVSEMYGGNYVNASTLKSENLIGKTLTIKSVEVQAFGREGKTSDKLVLSFNEIDKTLPLNKTNAVTIGKGLGDDYNTWSGKKIMLQLVNRMFKDTLVEAVGVLVPQ